MELPDKLNRKAVKRNFTKLAPETWEYLFDHEKENGLSDCRTQGWGVKHAWYATKPLREWLLNRGYYVKSDFEPKPPIDLTNHWSGLVARHAVSA